MLVRGDRSLAIAGAIVFYCRDTPTPVDLEGTKSGMCLMVWPTGPGYEL